ncbi:ionotropic receptor 25a [Octopus bimaculoides]|nr:ionotropic receptor 25a [Octopus bimaculoides]XP_052825716.1 ionotropic receptor 25a [Octopus bimaculoides]
MRSRLTAVIGGGSGSSHHRSLRGGGGGIIIVMAVIVTMLTSALTLSANQTNTSSTVVVVTSGDKWDLVVSQTEKLLPTVVNLTISSFENLINNICQNHSNELIIVLDTRTRSRENCLFVVCEQLFIPYISVFGFLPGYETSFPKHQSKLMPPALSMRASFADYQALFSDLIRQINISLDTLTVIYDADNKELTSIFDSYNEQGSTFLLTYEISSVLYDNIFQNLQSKMDARNFLAFGNTTALESVWEKAKANNLLSEFHQWVVVVTDNHLPVCRNCSDYIVMLLPVALSNESTCNTSSLYETYLADSVTLIDTVIEELSLDASAQQKPWNICCPLSGCTMHDITPSVQFMEKAVDTQFYGCSGPFSFDSKTGHRQVTFGLYHLKSSEIAEQFGYWNRTSGLVLFNPNETHRNNWRFKKLRAITIIEPPFVELHNGTFSGYTIDVFEKVANMTHFEYTISECVDKNYGTLFKNSTWGGCIGQMLRGDADVIVGSLSVTTERDAVVDFTLPYYDFAGIQILVKKKAQETKLFYFLDVFHLDVWLCLVAVLITTSILLYMFDRFSPFTNVDQNGDQRVFDMKESMWFVIGSLTQSGGGDPPSSFSSRVLVAGFWFFCIIMMSTFTANLAAFLTARRYTSDLSSLDDLAAQTEINFSVMANSSTMRYFERMAKIENLFDTKWKKMNFKHGSAGDFEGNLAVWNYPVSEKNANIWKRIQANGMVANSSEGLQRVRDGNFAYITESPIVEYYTKKYNDLTSIGNPFSSRPYAFAFKQNSELVDQFSKHILQLQQKSVLEDLKRKWWPKSTEETKVKDSEGLSVESLSGTFIVLGIGLACSLLFLALEVVWDKYKKLGNPALGPTTHNVSVIYDRPSYQQKESSSFSNGSMFTYANPAFTDSGFK